MLLLAFAVIGLGFFAALTLLVSRLRSNIAKWVLIGLAVLGLPMFLKHVTDGEYVGLGMIGFIQTAGQLFAYGLLFTRAARKWLKRDAAKV